MRKVTAKLRYLRISPRKVRLVADLIRKKSVSEAMTVLDFCVKKAAAPIRKLVGSAVANAEHDFRLDKSNLYISSINVTEAPTLKRWRPRARGRADEICKRASHVTIILDEFKGETKNIKEPKAPERFPKPEEIPEAQKALAAAKITKRAIGTKGPGPEPKSKIAKSKRIGKIKRIFKRKSF